MKWLLNLAVVLFVLTGCAGGVDRADVRDAGDDKSVAVPIRFHIVTDLTMVKDDVIMESWVTGADINDVVMPEINRIWAPAGISFFVESINKTKVLNPPDKAEMVNYIVAAKRNSAGKSDPERIRKLNQLIDWNKHSDTAINVYLVPYLGQTSQGNARRKDLRVFLGQYSDKSTRARRPPQRTKLTEALPFEIGSLSRTLAHEIGHILRLRHPDRSTQLEFNLLMGGKKQGYNLRQQDIDTAVLAARALVR